MSSSRRNSERAYAQLSVSATNTPNPTRKELGIMKKVKSLSPSKGPTKARSSLEIPNIFKKEEGSTSFCFTNVLKAK